MIKQIFFCLGLLIIGLPTVNAESISDVKPEIIHNKPIALAGIVYYGNPAWGAFSKAWKRFYPLARTVDNRVADVGYGVQIFLPDARKSGESMYFTAVEVPDINHIPIRMVAKQLPATHYAVFPVPGGSKNIKAMFRQIYNQWLPHSGYKLAEPYHFEQYKNNGQEVSLFIPVKK